MISSLQNIDCHFTKTKNHDWTAHSIIGLSFGAIALSLVIALAVVQDMRKHPDSDYGLNRAMYQKLKVEIDVTFHTRKHATTKQFFSANKHYVSKLIRSNYRFKTILFHLKSLLDYIPHLCWNNVIRHKYANCREKVEKGLIIYCVMTRKITKLAQLY